MDFTRQPIIETVISPKEGFKLLIRNSKEANQEEYLVHAVEIVSFGNALFYRCLERKPKAFLLPIADYDVVEVKEARMVLKNISTDKPIKIAESKSNKDSSENSKEESTGDGEAKKGNKKRHSRKRRSSKSVEKEAKDTTEVKEDSKESTQDPKQSKEVKGETKESHKKPKKEENKKTETQEKPSNVEVTPSSVVSVIFPPPPKIIGRKLPTTSEEDVSKPFPETAEKKASESHEEVEVAKPKDLPPLDQVQEVKDAKKAPAATPETDNQ